jgi:hypothetical protein
VTLTRSLKNVPSALQRSGTIDPSSMSNHACVSDATAYVLGAHFPDQGARYSAMEAEAADSRRYAGICSRFDAEAGLRIGPAGRGSGADLLRSRERWFRAA